MKKQGGIGLFEDPAAMEKENFIGEATCLGDVMGGHDDFHTLIMHGDNHFFQLSGGGGIKIGSGLIEKQEFRAQNPRPRHGEALLFAAGKQCCGAVGIFQQIGKSQRNLGALASCLSRESMQLQGIEDIGAHRATHHHRALKHHGLKAQPCIHRGGGAESLIKGRTLVSGVGTAPA